MQSSELGEPNLPGLQSWAITLPSGRTISPVKVPVIRQITVIQSFFHDMHL
jgi:hypothetical protein